MHITASELKEKMEKKEDTFLLDVRTLEEYQSWNIPGSMNIPMQMLNFRIEEIPKDKEIVAICAHGVRSKYVSDTLKTQGFNIKHLEGGMAAWNSVYDLTLLSGNIYQIKRIAKGCLGYLIVSNSEAVFVDPTTHTKEYTEMAKKFGCKIKAVIDTHQHADHISGARLLQNAAKCDLFLNPLDGYGFSGFREIKDGEVINIGNISIEVLHTPGHTKGSTCFLVDNKFLLTGDSLFVDGVARPDLKDKAEEYAGELYDTYQNKILNLKETIGIVSAHSRNMTDLGEAVIKSLGWIKKNNRIFELSKSEFIKYVVANIPSKPFNYEQIIKANKGELELTEEEISELEFGANKCVLSTS